MNKSRGGEPCSGVHGTHLGAERVSVLPDPQPTPLQRITSRLRLERVPVEPFVPSALYEYVDRSRVRQRLRWSLLMVGLLLTGAACYLWLRGPRTPPEAQPSTALGSNQPTTPVVAATSPSASVTVATPVLVPDQPAARTATSAEHAAAAPKPRPPTTKARSSVARPKSVFPDAPATTPPAPDSVSHPPKVPSDAPVPSSSAWWY